MTEIVPFEFEGAAVRVLTIDGEPWWVATDLCTVLGIGNARQAVSQLDSDEVSQVPVTTNDGSGRVLPTNIVNEPGMYSLVLRSRKPEAKEFKRWIKWEVLPQIRKTGGYGVREMTKLEALHAAIESEEARMAAETRAAVAEQRARELEPKALAHDTYLSIPDGGLLVRQVAKLLKWKEKDLRAFLVNQGMIYTREAPCGVRQWDFYANHATHFDAIEQIVEHRRGPCSHYTLVVTQRGVDLIHKRIEGAA